MRRALPSLVALLALAPAQDQDAELQAVRVRLFDLMDQAVWERDAAADVPSAPASTYRFDFDQATPRLWFGRPQERSMAWDEAPPPVEADGGRSGAGLALRAEEDYARAVFVLPIEGTCRVRVRARVRLEDNPKVGDASTREVLRVVEHLSSDPDPSKRTRRARAQHRYSRSHDPSGWDRVAAELVTESRTGSIEVQLLHRTGGAAEAITRFDDVLVEVKPLSRTEAVEVLSTPYRPRDGQEHLTPWRLRVGLGPVRDAVLLSAPTALRLPVRIPDAVHAPRLRFFAGVLPRVRQTPGDPATLTVAFREGDQETTLHELTLDVRRVRDHRRWVPVQVDLTPLAGREGELVLRSTDVDDEPDLDPLLVATPRIEPSTGAAPGRNVLLIGVDTLRADHMSAFGYERDTTPNLKALADVGVRFTQCRAQAPWTLPSFSSTLTSLYPSVHNAGRGGHDVWTPIDPTTVSLAEALSRVGYETAGLVANFLISPRYGLDQGFESYETRFGFESATNDVESVAEFVTTHTATPWFFFWHIMDPHLPYTTPADVREKFTEPDYDGQFQRGRSPEVPFQVLDPRPGRRWFAHEGPPPPPDLTEADARFVSDYYDAEIFEVDAAIGRLFDALKESGQWDRTVIAFVADHGEGLGDHDHYHHGYTLFDDQVHIPLLLRVPGRHEGRVIERPVGAIDLAPTLLGALDLPVPASFMGVDRLAEGAPADDAFFLEYPTYDSSAQKAWIRGRFKYLHDPVFHTEALYDLVADPGERTNLVAQHPEVVREARAALDAFRWEQQQVGRYHLRLRGKKGAKLELTVRTSDLFDANFASQPRVDEHDFAMDLARRELKLSTTLEEGALELVFWGRGETLSFEASLDGKALTHLVLPEDDGERRERLPAAVPRAGIPMLKGADLRYPPEGSLLLWLEAGAREMLPVVNTPEEIEALRALGYAR